MNSLLYCAIEVAYRVNGLKKYNKAFVWNGL